MAIDYPVGGQLRERVGPLIRMHRTGVKTELVLVAHRATIDGPAVNGGDNAAQRKGA